MTHINSPGQEGFPHLEMGLPSAPHVEQKVQHLPSPQHLWRHKRAEVAGPESTRDLVEGDLDPAQSL